MADVKIAEEGLTCAVCSEKYDLTTHLPKILPCFHSFCTSCLDDLAKETTTTCALCSRTFPVAPWSPNYALVTVLQHATETKETGAEDSSSACIMCKQKADGGCLECGDNYCDPHGKKHLQQSGCSGHHVLSLEALKHHVPPPKCAEHKQEYKFYCYQDNVLICMECFVTSHGGHKCKGIVEAYGEQKAALGDLVTTTREKQAVAEKEAKKLGEMEEEVKERIGKLKEEMKGAFEELHHFLTKREEVLQNELSAWGAASIKTIQTAKTELVPAQQTLQTSISQYNQLVTLTASEGHLLLLKDQLTTNLQKISLVSASSVISTPKFTLDSKIRSAIPELGRLDVSFQVSPKHSTVILGEGLSVARLDFASFVLQACTDENQEIKTGGTAGWDLKIKGFETDFKVTDHKNGKYEFDYRVPDAKSFEVSVLLRGEHIKGSPFQVIKRTLDGVFARQWGEIGHADGAFKVVAGATGHGKYIYVTNHENHRVDVFDSKGGFVRKFGRQGPKDGELQGPCDLVVVDEKDLYICDYSNNRIAVFTLEGVFKRNMPVGFFPIGICLFNSNLIVSNNRNHAIHVISKEGKALKQWGSFGTGNTNLSYPWRVRTDDQHIYVADSGNHRICVFDGNGKWKKSIAAKDSLTSPFCLAVSGEFVYVGDSERGRVVVFEKQSGKMTKTFGSKGNGKGQLGKSLYGLLVHGGEIYVSDSDNSRVVVFQ